MWKEASLRAEPTDKKGSIETNAAKLSGALVVCTLPSSGQLATWANEIYSSLMQLYVVFSVVCN